MKLCDIEYDFIVNTFYTSDFSMIDTYSDQFGSLDFLRSQHGSGMSGRSKASPIFLLAVLFNSNIYEIVPTGTLHYKYLNLVAFSNWWAYFYFLFSPSWTAKEVCWSLTESFWENLQLHFHHSTDETNRSGTICNIYLLHVHFDFNVYKTSYISNHWV